MPVDFENQERLTFDDVKQKQYELRGFLLAKIKYPFMSDEKEREIVAHLFANALLSQPALSKIRPVAKTSNGIIILMGSDVYDFMLKLVYGHTYVKDGKRYMKFGVKEKAYEFEASYLWKLLFDYVNILSAGALSESLLRSREIPKKGGMETTENLGGK